MKRWVTMMAATVALCAAAEPTLQLSLDRNRIYLGESVVARVSLNDGGQNPPAPKFVGGSPASIDYRGPQSSFSSYTTIVNGRRENVVNSSTTFTFVLTPSEAGLFDTGRPTLAINGKTLSCPSEKVRVMAPEDLDFVKATLSCPEKSVLVDGRFRIEATVSVRALPEPNASFEPIHPQRPLSLTAAYLDFPEAEGLRPPAAQDALNPLVAPNASLPYFTINGYQSSAFDFPGFGGFPSFGSPFRDNPVHFRPAPERVEEGGTNWWRYTFSTEYLATAEGTYSFGPLALKGSVITGAKPDGTAEMSELYIVAPAVEVRVTPPPEEGRPAWYSGAVGRSMAAKASLDAVRCKVGDPLTLTLDITGDVSAAAIRPPDIASQPGMPASFRIYGDHVESESIDGGKRFKYRLRPLEAGTLEFPAVLTAYYDSSEGRYETVSTDPIPLQVDATTQIAISAPGDGTDGDGASMPDGIVFAATDDLSVPLPFGLGALEAESLLARWPRWLLLPPGTWLLLLALKRTIAALRRWRWATRHRRAAHRARRRYARATQANQTAEALSAARALAAALMEEDAPSLTAKEFRERAARRGLDASEVAALANAMEALETTEYGRASSPGAPRDLGEAEHGRSRSSSTPQDLAALRSPPALVSIVATAIAATLLLAAGLLTPPMHIALERAPDPFDWERAQGVLAAAQSSDDFSEAARLYTEMADAGAATGPLFHNLGVALLMAGEPRAAARALDRAFRWRGASPELVNNRDATQRAIAAEDHDVSPTPSPFKRLVPPVQVRVAAFAAAWLLLWLALAVRLALHRGGKDLTSRAGGAARAAALLALLGLLAPNAGAAPAVTGIRAYARPARIYAGQSFEVCFEISLSQASDMSLGRPTGLPDTLELGTPYGEGIVGNGQGDNGGGKTVIRAVMPAFSAQPLEVAPARSAMDLGLVERTQTFFGTSTRTVRRTVPVQWESFEVLPLPEEGRPEGFAGAVGEFTLTSRFEPQTLAVGDIARWELSLQGKGRLNGAAITPPALDAALFKVYSAEPPVADGVLAAVARTVVPVSTQAVEVAGAAFDYFDPVAGRYARAVAPPVPVTVRERAPEEEATVKTIDLAAPGAEAVTASAAAKVTLRLAPAATALKTHQVAPEALETLEVAPGGWRRVRDAATGRTGWAPPAP